jgi:tetratricopeptide (TPR) repeat protein
MRSLTPGRAALAAFIVASLASTAAAQSGRVGGVVRDEMGDPIKAATIRAENSGGQPQTFTATTDAKGRFAMIGLRAGEWTFTAEAPGFDPQAGRVRVGAEGLAQPLLFSLSRSLDGPIAELGDQSPRDLQARLAEAEQLFATSKWNDALAAYQSILHDVPALSSINLQIGAIDRIRKDYPDAVEAYQSLLTADPGNAKATVGLAMARLESGDAAAAESVLRKAAGGQAPSPDVFDALGDVERAKGNATDAATWYQRAAAAAPSWGKPLYGLGTLALERGDRAQAAELLRKVLDIDPSSAEAAKAKADLARIAP